MAKFYNSQTTMQTLIIAEIGSSDDGSFGNARCLIDAATECGVDAVKFQTHIAEAETLPDAPMPPYFKGEPRFEYSPLYPSQHFTSQGGCCLNLKRHNGRL